jgi:Co/Zn/Cd efflux system component
MESLSAHVVADTPAHDGSMLRRLRTTLHDRFGIDHITIQVEPRDFNEERTHT